MKWREFGDLEWANFLVVNFGFVIGESDRAPHAARQKHRILPNEALCHIHKALVDRSDGPPILVLRLLEPDFEIGDDVVIASLSNLVPNLLGLGPVDEVLPEPFDDLLQVFVEVLLSAVVVDEVLDDETWELIDARVHGEPLVDDLVSKDVSEACVHGSKSHRPMILSSLLSRRLRMRVVSS